MERMREISNSTKLPYGISDFAKLRRDGCAYVDKTRFIETLEQADAPYIFFLRPRRFGKSLLVSLLSYYYDTASAALFADLFQETYIGREPTALKSQYYVLKFDFSGIDTSTRESTLQGFTAKINDGLRAFEQRYRLPLQYDTTGAPAQIFHSFLISVQFAIDAKLYVLIDEYDHFANELLSFRTDVFEEAVSQTGFVRKWYETLKIGTGMGLVDRIFATGVSPITLDSLTSGFNIAADMTRDRNLHPLLGFTETEVAALLRDVAGEADVDALLPDMRRYYDGYRFSEDAEERLFNPDMVLYYLTGISQYRTPPRDLIDTNIASDYAKLQQLFALKNRAGNYDILRGIVAGQPQDALLTRQFNLTKPFAKDDFLSLLFYLGLLTIESAALVGVTLTVPNYVIRELYGDFWGALLQKEADEEIDAADLRRSIAAFASRGDLAEFIAVVETTLEKLSFRDYIRFDEKYVKLVMLTYLMMSKTYYVKSEYETPGGYIDIALLRRSGVQANFEAILEIKYLKKEECSESEASRNALRQKIEEARQQLLTYQQADELRDKPNLKKLALVFAGSRCVSLEDINDE